MAKGAILAGTDVLNDPLIRCPSSPFKTSIALWIFLFKYCTVVLWHMGHLSSTFVQVSGSLEDPFPLHFPDVNLNAVL